MNIIKPSIEVELIDEPAMMKKLERIGRLCYKSEGAITPGSYDKFLREKIAAGHHSILEHASITVKFICDRGVTHELVRHRLCAFTQESTRYCNYSKDKYGNEITVIEPFYLDGHNDWYTDWALACKHAEADYLAMLREGASPQEARAVLPNSLKTEIVMTANIREWRHICELRADKAAHPQMQQIIIPLLLYFKTYLPPLFDDIKYNEDFPKEAYAQVGWCEYQ